VRICLAHRPDWDHPARPGLREALAACRSGSMLVVIKLDRLSRSLPDVRDFGGLGGQLECNPAHPRGGRRGRDGAVQLARAWGAHAAATAVRTPRWTRPSGRPYETRSPWSETGTGSPRWLITNWLMGWADAACEERSTEQLNELVYQRGTLHILIRATFSLEKIVEAHREVEIGRGRGKLVVVLGG